MLPTNLASSVQNKSAKRKVCGDSVKREQMWMTAQKSEADFAVLLPVPLTARAFTCKKRPYCNRLKDGFTAFTWHCTALHQRQQCQVPAPGLGWRCGDTGVTLHSHSLSIAQPLEVPCSPNTAGWKPTMSATPPCCNLLLCLPHSLQGPTYETPVIPVPALSTQSRQHARASPHTPHSLVGSVCIVPVIAVPFGAIASRIFLPGCCKAESLRLPDVQTHLTRTLPRLSLPGLCVGLFRLFPPPSDCFTPPHTHTHRAPRGPGSRSHAGTSTPSAPRGCASRRAPRLSGSGSDRRWPLWGGAARGRRLALRPRAGGGSAEGRREPRLTRRRRRRQGEPRPAARSPPLDRSPAEVAAPRPCPPRRPSGACRAPAPRTWLGCSACSEEAIFPGPANPCPPRRRYARPAAGSTAGSTSRAPHRRYATNALRRGPGGLAL